MKKALGQTVRDLKREVNKKVLKVPGVEQKVLDATSNEPWGPHGSNLADIAQATRNYHEYQMIMAVLWKRINDTGKNWRHVYKALTVLEYLVAHGSERVIDEIREHAYQISTLSDFQYIDSNGRDQGSNVRKKSQSLVILVNDKERIQEARQKASVNREKFRNTSSTGGMYKPSSYSSSGGYEDDRYGNRDDDRNGYGREREKEWGYRDDDRNSRGGDGDRYGRDSDDRYSRDGSRDDDYRERSQNNDEYQQGSRSRSSDRYKEQRAYEDDGRYSSRSSDAKAEDHSQDESARRLERKFSEQNLGAPPSYEEAVSDARSPAHDERDGEATVASTAKPSSPPSASPATNEFGTAAVHTNQETETFDEFDPRGPISAAPPPASNGEMDLLGSLSDSYALALMPVTSAATTSEAADASHSGSEPTFVALSSASTVLSQPFEDPFGDSPFKAIPTTDNFSPQPQNFASESNFQPGAIVCSEPLQPAQAQMQTSGFDFGDTFAGMTYTPSMTSHYLPPESSPGNENIDILADILPPPGPTTQIASHTAFSAPTGPPSQPSVHGNFHPQPSVHGNFHSQPSVHGNFHPQPGSAVNLPTVASQGVFHSPAGYPAQQNNDFLGNFSQMGRTTPMASSQLALPAPTGHSTQAQPPKDNKFETKSTVWADTLSRGLVNLNISGPKTNPLADIGVDFDSINRREKRERPAPATPVTSTISMGKAMGSGSGMGRGGASGLGAPPPNPMMGGGMGMGMGNYGGGMNQAPGQGMGMGMNNSMGMGMNNSMGMGMNNGMGMGMNNGMGMGMGMGMNMGMGMGQGGQMRPPSGFQQGPGMPGNYNPMMGTGGYPPQQPYGGYR